MINLIKWLNKIKDQIEVTEGNRTKNGYQYLIKLPENIFHNENLKEKFVQY